MDPPSIMFPKKELEAPSRPPVRGFFFEKEYSPMEQIIIAYKAYKRILEAARLLAAANERVLADEARALAEKLEPRNVQ